jgi:hypothetical protein
MPDSLAEAVEFLERARDCLVRQSQQIAAEGDWTSVKRLIDLAERTDGLHQEIRAMTASGHTEKTRRAFTLLATPEESQTLLEPWSPRKAEEYPKYRVRDGVLVKQGLQRDGKHVYEHAVPHERFTEIVSAVAAKATRGGKQKPFTIDQVQEELDCPRYMTYVVVSLLVRQGLLVRARKGSYTLAAPSTLGFDAANLWKQLQGENTP